MMMGLSIGMAVSVGVSMLRVLTGIPVMALLLPGYAVALILSFFVPPIFTAIAFDSGGVASGPMTATFLLPLAMGACEAAGGNILTDAFGVVAMVAMTPLITIQIIGLIYRLRTGKDQPAQDAAGNEIIEFDLADDARRAWGGPGRGRPAAGARARPGRGQSSNLQHLTPPHSPAPPARQRRNNMNDTHSPVVCLVTIVDRGKGCRVTDVLRMAGVAVQLVLLGQGTASTEMMDCLGLDGPEKDVVISLARGPRTAVLLDRLTLELNLTRPGRGHRLCPAADGHHRGGQPPDPVCHGQR